MRDWARGAVAATSADARTTLVGHLLGGGARLEGGSGLSDGSPLPAFEPVLAHLRQHLSQAGVAAGNLVALVDLEPDALITATLAIWQLDAVPLPCASLPDSPPVRAAFVLSRDGDVRTPQLKPTVPGLEATAVVHVSSGSTGVPKLAKRSVASVWAEAAGYRVALALTRSDNVLVPVPLHHSYGWGFAMSALLNGCAVKPEVPIRAGRVARRIDRGTVSVVALTAPLARLLTETERTGGDTRLRAAMVGAGPVGVDLDDHFATRFGIRLSRNYGASETGPTFVGEPGLPPDAIGRPMLGVRVIQPAPGSRGELRLETSVPVSGYVDGAARPSRRWRTGDVVYHGHNGIVRFVNRLRPALRINGRFVDVRPLERTLGAVSGVEDVYLLSVPRPDEPEMEDLYAVVAGGQVDRTTLEACRVGLPTHIPVPRIVRCTRLPYDVTGKPDRRALIALVHGRA